MWGDGVATWRRSLRPWPMLRAVLFVLIYFSMDAAILVLPLSAIAAGIYTAPPFVAALSMLLIGEPERWRGPACIASGFAGVLLILQPGAEAFTWLMFLPVMAGFFYALSLSIALLLTGAAMSTVLHIWQPTPAQVAVSPFLLGSWSVLGLSGWGFVAMLAALMVGNGLVLPAAYQSAPSVIIATFDYCYLIFATVFDFLFFSEVPDLQTIIGILMIAGAGLLAVRN